MKRTLWPAISLLALAACSNEATAPAETTDAETPPAEAVETETAETRTSDELLLPLPDATSAEITADDLAVRIKTLADDAFEGRGPGSEAGEKAPVWIAAEMERIGLEPGGDNGSWYQSVGMVEQTLDENASSLTFEGGRSGEAYPMTLKQDAVLWTKHQDAQELDWSDSDLVFVGYGVVAPEDDWNDYEGVD
ncbi:MAG: peptidase M28, partial [Henriciella sp.]